MQGCKQEIDMAITLTTKQIMAMADFAGLKVDTHGLDINDETEYTIEPCRDKETGRVHVFYCTEYPEEGAIQLD
ncbi:phage protein [Proteus mirabilis HI4320]|uniref:Phage protein n=2 Tax=Proteus mirabilis TaxID=584 RepID=B4EVH2_PROMH|nr:phage protein [Proteus mirabilis HI4320]